MSQMIVDNGEFKLTKTIDNSGTHTAILATSGKFVDKNIGINISVPSASSVALSVTDSATALTVGNYDSTDNVYPFSAQVTGTVTPGTAGWISGSTAVVDSSAVVGTLAPATFSASGDTVSCSAAGYVPTGSVGAVTHGTMSAVASDPGNTYTEDQTTVLASGGWLQLTSGYYPATKISLATLVPDSATYPNTVQSYSAGMLSGVSMYDSDGVLQSGSITTYDGTYTES